MLRPSTSSTVTGTRVMLTFTRRLADASGVFTRRFSRRRGPSAAIAAAIEKVRTKNTKLRMCVPVVGSTGLEAALPGHHHARYRCAHVRSKGLQSVEIPTIVVLLLDRRFQNERLAV